MKEAARVAARGARDVAVTRAEELLGRRLRQYTRLEEFAAWVSDSLGSYGDLAFSFSISSSRSSSMRTLSCLPIVLLVLTPNTNKAKC